MVTVTDLFNSFLLSKARAGRSERYCGLLLKQLRCFASGREARAVFPRTADELLQAVATAFAAISTPTVTGSFCTPNTLHD